MSRYDNAPVYEWDAIQEEIDLPNLQRTFAGIINMIIIFILIIIICVFIVKDIRQVFLVTLSVSCLTLRLEISSLLLSLTFLGWVGH